MIKISGYLQLSGGTFSPSEFENQTQHVLREKIEPGEKADRGRFAGIPSPYGAGILDFRESDAQQQFSVDPLVLNLLISQPDMLASLGVTDRVIYFNVEYDDQCNLELLPATLEILSQVKVPIAISCYRSPEIIAS